MMRLVRLKCLHLNLITNLKYENITILPPDKFVAFND